MGRGSRGSWVSSQMGQTGHRWQNVTHCQLCPCHIRLWFTPGFVWAASSGESVGVCSCVCGPAAAPDVHVVAGRKVSSTSHDPGDGRRPWRHDDVILVDGGSLCGWRRVRGVQPGACRSAGDRVVSRTAVGASCRPLAEQVHGTASRFATVLTCLRSCTNPHHFWPFSRWTRMVQRRCR